MDVYSLEEEDVGNIFVTQQSRNIVPLVPNFEDEHDMETEEPAVTQNNNLWSTHNLDISEYDDFQIPCSQVQNKENDHG